ncbi:MAG TPA: rod shape-determining protein RodA [Rickettsiales bacterium]|nr:rod shape-determining protein RodA [Rickettsiales bacterium]
MDSLNQVEIPFTKRIFKLNWVLISLVLALTFIGFLMLYSAGSGNMQPWLIKQMTYFTIFFPIMILIAITDIRIWFKFAYIAYALALILVIAVDIAGHNALGATRWIKIGDFTLQPSEIMKVCMVYALARYFYEIEMEEVRQMRYLIIPLLIIAAPSILIFIQPDLGTASILSFVGIVLLFIAGVKLWKFIATGIITLCAIPFLWIFVLYDYQKQRILTFLNPNSDPLGSGYNIIQSKIAIGSGGFFGKGYLQGTQGQLDFLPEKQTDFIFTMLAEELGLIGSLITIVLYGALIFFGTSAAIKITHQYGKLLTIGIINILFIHMFINIGMVSGILPVVGAPLPFISYGGTISASILIGFGLLLNADLYKNASLK